MKDYLDAAHGSTLPPMAWERRNDRIARERRRELLNYFREFVEQLPQPDPLADWGNVDPTIREEISCVSCEKSGEGGGIQKDDAEPYAGDYRCSKCDASYDWYEIDISVDRFRQQVSHSLRVARGRVIAHREQLFGPFRVVLELEGYRVVNWNGPR